MNSRMSRFFQWSSCPSVGFSGFVMTDLTVPRVSSTMAISAAVVTISLNWSGPICGAEG